MSETKTYDVAVIGQGPAGMTAALYTARAGLSTVSFEGIGPGGQMANTEHLDNYPGFTEGVDPYELSDQMSGQAARFGAEHVFDEVTSLELDGPVKRFETAASGAFQARAVVLAMGAEPRPLGVAREAELTGRGVSYCATCDGGFFRGKPVIVVGGGNTAVGDALYLGRLCSEVHLVHRRQQLRADAVYAKPLDALQNLTRHMGCVVEELVEADGKVAGAKIRNLETGEVEQVEAAAVFVAVGTLPKNSLVKDSGIAMDATGYVIADELGATSIPGVFVAGDLRTKALRQVSTAVGDGANAATSVFEYLSLQ